MRYLALLLLVVGCSRYDIPFTSNVFGPKFKVGDCIDRVYHSYETEFINEVSYAPSHPRKILAIGNKNYLYQFGSIKSEAPFNILDNYNIKVNCKAVGF